MIVALASTCALLILTPASDAPEKWVAELGSGYPDAAIKSLVAAEPAETLPLLVSCVRDQPLPHAWQASRTLRAIASKKGKDSAWKAQAPALSALVLDDGQGAERRMIAALGLRGPSKAAGDQAEALAEVFQKEAPAEVYLGVSFALAGMGKYGAAELKPLVDKGGYTELLWAATTAAAKGKDARKLQKVLAKRCVDGESLAASFTYRSLLMAVEEVAGSSAAGKAAKKRERIRLSWKGGKGVNFNGITINRIEDSALHLASTVGYKVENASELDLPGGVDTPAGGDNTRLGAVAETLSVHLTRRVHDLESQFEAGEFEESYKDWTKATEKVVATAGLLASVDRFVPQN